MGFNPIAAVGAALGGDILGTAYANRQQEKMMHEQMDFQQKMRETRYQTEVMDLKKAGLNPMLAYGNSNPPSPSGAMAPVQKPNIAEAINQSRMTSAQEANIRADTENKKIQNDLIKVQTEVQKSTAELNAAQLEKVQAEIVNTQQMWENIVAEGTKKYSEAELNAERIKTEKKLQVLRQRESDLIRNQIMISDPKAAAAATTGAFAAHGENISKGLSPLSDFLKFGGKSQRKKYPKKAGD